MELKYLLLFTFFKILFMIILIKILDPVMAWNVTEFINLKGLTAKLEKTFLNLVKSNERKI